MILTPDQRAGLSVFDAGRARGHSATLARRTGRHAVREEDDTTWSARSRPGIWASRYVVLRADDLQTHRACRPHLKICGGQATSRASPQTQPAATSQRRRHPRWSMALRTPARPCSKAWLHPTRRPNAACGQRTPRARLVPTWCQPPDGRGVPGCQPATGAVPVEIAAGVLADRSGYLSTVMHWALASSQHLLDVLIIEHGSGRAMAFSHGRRAGNCGGAPEGADLSSLPGCRA